MNARQNMPYHQSYDLMKLSEYVCPDADKRVPLASRVIKLSLEIFG